MNVTPLPPRASQPTADTPEAWASQALGTLDMHVQRTRNGIESSYAGNQALTATDFAAQGQSLNDAMVAARDLSRDANTPVAVLQARDGQVFTALVHTAVNPASPPFLQLRGAHGALRTEAIDYAVRTDLPAGYHDYSVSMSPANTDLGRALHAIVTDRAALRLP